MCNKEFLKTIERIKLLTMKCCSMSIQLYSLNNYYEEFNKSRKIDVQHLNALFNELKLQLWNNFCINMREYTKLIIKILTKQEILIFREEIKGLKFLSFFLSEKNISKPLSFSLHNFSEFEYKNNDIIISRRMLNEINEIFKNINKEILYKEFKLVVDLIYKIKLNKKLYWSFHVSEQPLIVHLIRENIINK